MIEALKNFARSILSLPYDAAIFRERKPDAVERWSWCRQYKLASVVVFYSEECLKSEMLMRTMIMLEPDLRNLATPIFLPVGQPGVRELMSKLGVTGLPQVVLTDREGKALRHWGTTPYPMDLLAAAGKLQ